MNEVTRDMLTNRLDKINALLRGKDSGPIYQLDVHIDTCLGNKHRDQHEHVISYHLERYAGERDSLLDEIAMGDDLTTKECHFALGCILAILDLLFDPRPPEPQAGESE